MSQMTGKVGVVVDGLEGPAVLKARCFFLGRTSSGPDSLGLGATWFTLM